MSQKKILGISAYYHDSAAALLINGKVIAAAQEERFTREKHTADFPIKAIQYCLTEANLKLDDLDAVVFYDKPFLTFERLLQTYYAFAPKGLISFLKAIPVWLREKLFLKSQLYKGLKEVGKYQKSNLKLLFSEHHLSHAASAFYASPFEEAAILTIDGVGEWATASISVGKGKNIKMLKEMEFPHSLGLLYSAFTYYMGFRVNSGEYKLMGLAPYGNPTAPQTVDYINQIKTHIVDVKSDGSIFLNQTYFNYATGLRMTKDSKWEDLFKLKRRKEHDELTQEHCNFALAIQKVTEEIVLLMAKEAKAISQCDNLCMAGGVALNCVANGKLRDANVFEKVYVQAAAGDAGGALGAALSAHHMYYEEARDIDYSKDFMKGTQLGPSYSTEEIKEFNRSMQAKAQHYEDRKELYPAVAEKLVNGNVIGWFQGRMEFGPRALGHRSIIADPRDPEMQKRLNLKIKARESFRPFAPSVLAKDAEVYFKLSEPSPYMLFTADLKENQRMALPDNFHTLSLKERLSIERSTLPAITHLDYSARVQTVDDKDHPEYAALLKAFKKESGLGMLVNTSFNVRGEPMVCTPEDAYHCFMNTEMDYLVIENFLYKKTDQKDWQNKKRWAKKFKAD